MPVYPYITFQDICKYVTEGQARESKTLYEKYMAIIARNPQLFKELANSRP